MSVQFKYEARGASGRLERGLISAADREEALARLNRRKLTPLELKPAPQGAQAARLTDKAARDLSRTLAQLLRAGLSLSQALRFASEELPPAAASAAARMRETAESGEPASSGLDEFTGGEARLLKGVMRAGETSGRLAEALETAAVSFARSAELRARMGTALIYPGFVIAATMATLACFMLVVVPTLAQAFSGAEERLPDSTRALLALSEWLQANGLLVLLACAAIVLVCSVSEPVRLALSRVRDRVLASPIALGVAARLEYSAFSGLAALALHAGVPSGLAFDAAAQGVRNARIRAELLKAVAAIRTGERPSVALDRCARPPQSFLRLMHIGEETGRLADALKNASAMLSAEAEQRLERLGAIAGPIVTLMLGALVASVVASLFLGLLALSDLAEA
jgi:general secretion pathway protein F